MLDREVITTVSGSSSTAELFARLTDAGITPIHVYGSTELYGPYMICERQEGWSELGPEEQAEFLGRQGVPYVVAEPQQRHDGYFDDPEQTEEALAGGWCHSGDLAVRHADGHIELRDRKKDIIVSGGENIPAIEVEQAIAEHPAGADVAVVSMPDEKWGERPKAFVELADGEDASEEDILAFAKERFTGYMRPAAVEFTELPRTSTGKIQKKQLRDAEWEGHGRRVGARSMRRVGLEPTRPFGQSLLRAPRLPIPPPPPVVRGEMVGARARRPTPEPRAPAPSHRRPRRPAPPARRSRPAGSRASRRR